MTPLLFMLACRPLLSIDEVVAKLVALQASIDWVNREVHLWRSPMDERLRPFALALGRLLALDVQRHPRLPEDS